MKKKVSTILITLVFVVGLLVMLYPSVSNWYNEQMNSYVVSGYVEVVADTSAEEFSIILEEAMEYNATLTGTVDTFVSGKAEGEDYISAMNVYNGMIGYLTIDKIDVELVIYHGTDEAVLQSGIGHLEGTQLPTGEIGNNTVLTGHTGLPSADLLTDLTEMELGDLFQVTVLDKEYTYQVFDITVVEPTETELLLPIEGKDVVTLVTCTPYGINSHRLLVQGEQIAVKDLSAVVEVEEVVVSNTKTLSDYMPRIAIAVLVVLALIAVIRSIILKPEIKATKVADKVEHSEAKISRLHARYLKDEAKYLKKENKRIQKIEQYDQKVELKIKKQLDKQNKKRKNR